jgi:glucuronokinase
MISIARKHNSAAKFPGSGGAIVGLCRDAAAATALKQELEANGFVYVDVIPNAASPSEEDTTPL